MLFFFFFCLVNSIFNSIQFSDVAMSFGYVQNEQQSFTTIQSLKLRKRFFPYNALSSEK